VVLRCEKQQHIRHDENAFFGNGNKKRRALYFVLEMFSLLR
jgi:hypothetical protein